MRAIVFFLVMAAVAAYAVDDQLVQQALKNNAVVNAGKLDVVRFGKYSTATQNKLTSKLSQASFSSYTSIYRVPATRTVNGQTLSEDVTITTISGNAGTATALEAGGTVGRASCWKADGVLGYCSTVITAEGSCTCN